MTGARAGKVKALSAETVAAVSNLLGHEFADQTLLATALTHGSSSKRLSDYQRLEFLGDRVLALVIAHALFDQDALITEGQMAMRHSGLVNGDMCAIIAEKLGLSEHIVVGSSERAKGVQRTRSILSDVMEALIGAVYLDGGPEPARRFILAQWQPYFDTPQTATKDPKTFLQEWALARALPLPRYEILKRAGPEHKPEFTIRLNVGTAEASTGLGPSKQAAEMDAARNFLAREGIR
jgi:ribonuclease III